MRWLLTLTLAAYAVANLSAHDLWLIPEPTAQPGMATSIRAHSGMDFPKGETPPDPSRFARRRVLDPEGKELELQAAGTEKESGLLRFTPKEPGIYVAAVETQPKLISLNAQQFNEYLVSDGLPHVYLLRSKEKSLDRPARERYTKSPKVLLQVGAGKGDATRVLGLPLEIVPLRDPFLVKVGEALPVRVLFRDQPLADANLGWDHPGDGEPPSGTVRTNSKGEALIPIAQSGLMTIRLTHMTRPNTADYEWESFWTTLTWRRGEDNMSGR